MYIPQNQLDKIKPGKNRIIIIYGPRRVGKTTLLNKFLEAKKNYLFVTGEDLFVQQALSTPSIEKLKAYIGSHTLLVIDEAQHIPSIGVCLKLIADHLKEVQVVVSGSSSLDLCNKVGEPLTGRQRIVYMYPTSQIELKSILSKDQMAATLDFRLIYGSYPEIITTNDKLEKQTYLKQLVSSYLLKDILAFEGVKKSKKMFDLLTLLAFQIGKEVSLNELATALSINKATVERYLNLLEEVFVLYNIRGFSRNLRKEVTKTSRYYFYDNGIRNALINNFNPLNVRDDIGQLWENFLVTERIKKQHYQSLWSNNYFWRTYDQKEIDWVEEREGKLFGYEFKWGKKMAKAPKLWQETYSNASFECINIENYLSFIT